MPIKKSELYSSLWKSCDELRGGMDASQYKDYVLVMLFVKYISDKYANDAYPQVIVPEGASFRDMVGLKGKPSIGDDINKKIIGPIAAENQIADVPDFNDSNKLGSGKEMVDRLTNLIAIFENPALDFSRNMAEGDDILGDAYEYLMRHFATESGKSKGQFYTPAEVSRIMAKVLGIGSQQTSSTTTVYDPTCGSGSLLLKVGDEASTKVSLYGQEMDNATASLARMNMILHDNPTAVIRQGNTLSMPLFKTGEALQSFDFVVANPPFSFKSWTTGLEPNNDPYGRFEAFGIPPAKNGDYAFLLHILKSLKSTGKGAVILPHGVLFRGNTEADIRRNLILRGYIKGIIGLPANLFYGTGIPACIIMLDKEQAANRKGIFMIDASNGFMKDGPKNRLRDQDIHKIVDVFSKQLEIPKFSRFVPMEEIAKKDFNLNLPRYIDSQEEEDIQDIEAHLKGGIPDRDIEALNNYWDVYPTLKTTLFEKTSRKGYSELKIDKSAIKSTIYEHPEFTSYSRKVMEVFEGWQAKVEPVLRGIDKGVKPKQLIHQISEELLEAFADVKLIDKYDFYQRLMDYWAETMQDDVFVIAVDGWEAGQRVYRVVKTSKDKGGKAKEREVSGIEGIANDLIAPSLIISHYFAAEKAALDSLETERDSYIAQLDSMVEEHGIEDGLLADARDDKDNISAASVKARLKVIKGKKDFDEERRLLEEYLQLSDKAAEAKQKIKVLQAELERKVWERYELLSIGEVKALIIENKWISALLEIVSREMRQLAQRMFDRTHELAIRYEESLSHQLDMVKEIEIKVNAHLKKMGFVWN
jgi:type I restriction enzyme M protein